MTDCKRVDPCGECDACVEAFDKWEAEAPEREQRLRERLDSEGYYDDPDGWQQRRNNGTR
jgi:hypothetical protein